MPGAERLTISARSLFERTNKVVRTREQHNQLMAAGRGVAGFEPTTAAAACGFLVLGKDGAMSISGTTRTPRPGRRGWCASTVMITTRGGQR